MSPVLKQKSRPTAANAKTRRLSDTHVAPLIACDKKLSGLSSKGGPTPKAPSPVDKVIINDDKISWHTELLEQNFS